MEAISDILVLPFFGQGHLFPCVELCKHFSSHKIRSILIIPSHLSSSIPNSLHHHPLVEVLQVPASYAPLPPSPPHTEIVPVEAAADVPEEGSRSVTRPGPKPVHHHHQQLGRGIESFISERYNKNVPRRTQPGCVVMDVMMSWSKEIFMRENIPIVSFFTSGACSTAMEYAAWKAHLDDMGPNETRILSGLPESIAVSYSDLKRRDWRHRNGRGMGGPPRAMDFGPPRPGQPPRWLDEAEGSTALLINSCDDLEGPFLEYLAGQTGKPVLGVGPLLPEKYLKSTGSVLHDRDSRPNRESYYTEDEIIQWLDSKPSQSVIYVSFGSEVGPTLEEYDQLAEALRESNRAFIWVIQPGSGKPGPPANFFGGKTGSNAREEGYHPHGLEERVRDRGLIIKGWAPQLLILSHPSIGGFLSHCGWNSTVEAIGRGVPILAWPIRGDQFYDAKLVVQYLKVGHMVSSGNGLAEMVKKSDIMRGIDRLMDDGEVHGQAITLRNIFEPGYPSSSVASLKALIELIKRVAVENYFHL